MCLMVVEGMKGASVRLRHQLQRRSFTIRNTFIVIGLYLWRMAVITRQIMIGPKKTAGRNTTHRLVPHIHAQLGLTAAVRLTVLR